MKGVHEDRDGDSTFLYAVYNRGSIVRLFEKWGVVTNQGGRYSSPAPYVTWFTDDGWTTAQRCLDAQLSAPYAHAYEGIPEEVLAKATHLMLDTSTQHDTTDHD